MEQTSNLEQIHSFSVPSNHIVNVNLVRDQNQKNSYAPEYYFFITLIPGASQSSENSSNRTYDANSKVTLKYSTYEIASLAFALKQYAQGNGKHINYIKFGANKKTISLAENSKKQETRNGDLIIREVLFKVFANNKAHSVALSLHQAYAFGDVLDVMFKKAIDFEFQRQLNTISYNSSNSSKNIHATNTKVSANQDSPPFDVDDDNSNFIGNSGSFDGFSSPFM